jgi:hypothetical protein
MSTSLFVRTSIGLACCVAGASAGAPVHTLPGNSPLIRCDHYYALCAMT